MKFAVAITLLLSMKAWSLVPTFDPRPDMLMVLGIDKKTSPYENPWVFPCAFVGTQAVCEKTLIQIENDQCARTLFVDRIAHKMEVSCMIKLKKVVLAVTVQTARVPQKDSRYDYIPLRFTKAISVQHSFDRKSAYKVIVNP